MASKELSKQVDEELSTISDIELIRKKFAKKGFKAWEIDQVLEQKIGRKKLIESYPIYEIKIFDVFWRSIFQPKKLYKELKEKDLFFQHSKYGLFTLGLFIISIFIAKSILSTLEPVGKDLLTFLVEHDMLFFLILSGYFFSFDVVSHGFGWSTAYLTWKKGSFSSHFLDVKKSYIYSSTLLPLLLIPFVNIVTSFYTLYLQTIAQSVFLEENIKQILWIRSFGILFDILLTFYVLETARIIMYAVI